MTINHPVTVNGGHEGKPALYMKGGCVLACAWKTSDTIWFKPFLPVASYPVVTETYLVYTGN